MEDEPKGSLAYALRDLLEGGERTDYVDTSSIRKLLPYGMANHVTIDKTIQDIWLVKTKRISDEETKYYGLRFKKQLKQSLPDRLSAAVVHFCRENFHLASNLSVHGNITVVADNDTTVAFFSRKIHSATDEGEREISDNDADNHMTYTTHLPTGTSTPRAAPERVRYINTSVGGDHHHFSTISAAAAHRENINDRQHFRGEKRDRTLPGRVHPRSEQPPSKKNTQHETDISQHDVSQQDYLPVDIDDIKSEPDGDSRTSGDAMNFEREAGTSRLLELFDSQYHGGGFPNEPSTSQDAPNELNVTHWKMVEHHTQQSTAKDARKVELVDGSGLEIDEISLSVILAKSKDNSSKLIRHLLEYFFPENVLAASCATGSKGSKKLALDFHTVQAIRAFVMQRDSSISDSKITSVITTKCCDARKVVMRRQ